MKHNIVGAVMAGGFSRRFGEPKAFAIHQGKYFFEYSLDALEPISDQVVIVTNKVLESRFKKVSERRIIKDSDLYKGKGPLAGLYTVMEELESEWYAIAPVDTPFIRPEVYHRLLEAVETEHQAVIAQTGGRDQPLLALYHFSLKPMIKVLLETDRLAIQALLQNANVKYISYTESDAFININEPRDYHRYIKGGE